VSVSTELECLQAMRCHLAVPERWCSHGPWDGNAFCLTHTAFVYGRGMPAELATRRLGRLLGVGPCWIAIGDWNDTHSHADVVRLLDKAIAECLQEQAAAGGEGDSSVVSPKVVSTDPQSPGQPSAAESMPETGVPGPDASTGAMPSPHTIRYRTPV
jgi:hypothetical protein